MVHAVPGYVVTFIKFALCQVDDLICRVSHNILVVTLQHCTTRIHDETRGAREGERGSPHKLNAG